MPLRKSLLRLLPPSPTVTMNVSHHSPPVTFKAHQDITLHLCGPWSLWYHRTPSRHAQCLLLHLVPHLPLHKAPPWHPLRHNPLDSHQIRPARTLYPQHDPRPQRDVHFLWGWLPWNHYRLPPQSLRSLLMRWLSLKSRGRVPAGDGHPHQRQMEVLWSVRRYENTNWMLWCFFIYTVRICLQTLSMVPLVRWIGFRKVMRKWVSRKTVEKMTVEVKGEVQVKGEAWGLSFCLSFYFSLSFIIFYLYLYSLFFWLYHDGTCGRYNHIVHNSNFYF